MWVHRNDGVCGFKKHCMQWSRTSWRIILGGGCGLRCGHLNRSLFSPTWYAMIWCYALGYDLVLCFGLWYYVSDSIPTLWSGAMFWATHCLTPFQIYVSPHPHHNVKFIFKFPGPILIQSWFMNSLCAKSKCVQKLKSPICASKLIFQSAFESWRFRYVFQKFTFQSAFESWSLPPVLQN